MSQTQPFDFKSAIQRVINEFEAAFNAKSAAKLASFYTDDATLLPPGSPPIKGRSEIQRFWQNFLDAGAADGKLHTVSVESSGELAYEIGTYDATVPLAQGVGTVRSSGKYLVVWKRQADGVKLVADMFSPNA